MFEFSFSIAATKENLSKIDRRLLEILEEQKVVEPKRFHYALHEVVINAIQAGERQASDFGILTDIVEISIRKDDKNLTGSVKDFFGGIDKEAIVKTDCVFSECGRGMLLIEHLVDDIKFEFLNDGGFLVSIRKTI